MTWKSCDCDCCRTASLEIKRLQAENERLTEERDGEFIRAELKDLRREKAQQSVSDWRRQCAELEGRATERMFQIDALEAENRVVRELVEEALDYLWVRDKEYYQRVLDRCTWMMEEVEVDRSHEGRDELLARIAALLREYSDYQTVAGHCSVVYDHFSGGRISKPFTLPSEVIAQAEAIQEEDFREWHKEYLEIALDPIRTRLQEFAQAWEESGSDDLEQTDLGNELAAWIEETFKETS